MKRGNSKESPWYTVAGAFIILFVIFLLTGGNIPFLKKSEAAVKHIRYDIKGVAGMPTDLQKQMDQGLPFLFDNENGKMYIVIKSEGTEFSHVSSVKQENDNIHVNVDRFRLPIAVYTTPPYLVEIQQTKFPVIVKDHIIENVYPGKELKEEWEKERAKIIADFL